MPRHLSLLRLTKDEEGDPVEDGTNVRHQPHDNCQLQAKQDGTLLAKTVGCL